MARLADS
ncbi:hypothetical protein VCCP103710_1175, partial [Vibrio cholerae CP1037(10)]